MLHAFENFYDISNEYDINDTKIGSYIESAYKEFIINCKESELKVIEESGTDGDLEFLYEAANEGFVSKLKNAIAAIIKAFTQFISDLKDKVVRIIVKKESRDQLRKIEKKIALHPLLARKKVKIYDPKKELKFIREYQDKCDKLSAKLLAKADTIEITTVGALSDAFDEQYRKIIVSAAASVSITLVALVKLINKQIDELPQVLNGINKDTSGALKKIMNSAIDDEAAASCKAAYTAVSKFRSQLGKKEANLQVQYIMENIKTAKRALKIDKSKRVIGESYEDDIEYFERSNAKKDDSQKSKKSNNGLLRKAEIGAGIAGLAIASKGILSMVDKRNIGKLLSFYEDQHQGDLIPATDFNVKSCSATEASDFGIRGAAARSVRGDNDIKYIIYFDSSNTVYMYTIVHGDMNSKKATFDFFTTDPMTRRHAAYYTAYMAYRTGKGDPALTRFKKEVSKEFKKYQNRMNESVFDNDYSEDFFNEYYDEVNDLFNNNNIDHYELNEYSASDLLSEIDDII